MAIHAINVSGSSTSTGSFGAGYIDNKLGIGTTSPDEKLHISSGHLKLDSSQRLKWGSTSYITADTSDLILRAADGDDIRFKTDAAGTTRVIIKDDGKVGIGTDAPAYNLDVRSTAATMNLSSTNGNATIYFNKSDINKGAVLVFQKAGGDLWRQGAFAHGGGSKDDYAIKNSVTGTGHCFVIDTGDDNVGIQTYAPAYTLDVDGNIGYSGTITDYSLRRIKENIEEVPVGIIDKFKKLPIYTFNKKVKVDANLIKDAVVNEFGQRRWDLLYPSGSHHSGNLWNCSDGEIKTFIDDFAEEQRVDGRRDIMWQKTSKHYGLIADDDILEQEFPELVGWKPKYYYNEESGSSMKDKTQPEKFGIKTDSYVGMLHAVVKELVTKVESLEAQVSGSR